MLGDLRSHWQVVGTQQMGVIFLTKREFLEDKNALELFIALTPSVSSCPVHRMEV